MKKIVAFISALLLATLLAFSLSGCINSQTSSTSSYSSAASSSESAASSESSTGSASSDDGSSADSHLASEAYDPPADISVEENGSYSDKDHVALYIHTYGTLPSNFISKSKARKAGWVSSKGNLWDVLPGKSIGGSVFHNDDGALPDAKGREWHECDIDYEGGYRNSKRIVYSNDGLVYYTEDHYNTFQQLY